MHEPAPRWNVVVIAWAVGLGIAFAVASALVAWHDSRRVPGIPYQRDTVREALHDSIQSERARDRMRLNAWADSILRLRGDSLATVWLARPARRIPGRIDSILLRDTLHDTLRLPGAAVRADAVRDSAREQVIDSMAGELVQRDYDLRECVSALATSPRASRWTVGAGIIGDVDGIRPTASVGHRWGRFEFEGGAVVDRSRPGVLASARWAF